jgi:hypothetical protein
MPTYVIERNIPKAGELTQDQLAAIARQSNAVVDELDADYRWIHSYVTGDRIYCVHEAPDAETVLEHAKRGGFPADSIAEVTSTIDPTTAVSGA